jgi:hypothetical protein
VQRRQQATLDGKTLVGPRAVVPFDHAHYVRAATKDVALSEPPPNKALLEVAQLSAGVLSGFASDVPSAVPSDLIAQSDLAVPEATTVLPENNNFGLATQTDAELVAAITNKAWREKAEATIGGHADRMYIVERRARRPSMSTSPSVPRTVPYAKAPTDTNLRQKSQKEMRKEQQSRAAEQRELKMEQLGVRDQVRARGTQRPVSVMEKAALKQAQAASARKGKARSTRGTPRRTHDGGDF